MMDADDALVIVGGGMAAGRLLRCLAERGYDSPIILVSAEAERPYNRVLLPDLLTGRCSERELGLPGCGPRIRFLGGTTVTGVDLRASRIHCADGAALRYRRLVLATGATVPVPEVPGIELPGVSVFRTLSDARRLRSVATGADVCVVGGGLLGLETARSLAAIGARVSVVHRAQRLLNRQLDAHGSAVVQSFLEGLGIRCLLGETVAAIEGDCSVRAVRLASGRAIEARAVIFATGTRPDDRLARGAGLATNDGIVTSDRMETSAADVFALGECARVAGTAYAMVEPVHRQADVLADRLTGGRRRFSAAPCATRLKVAGLAVFAAGTVGPEPGSDDVIIEDPGRRVYRRYCYQGDVLTGAVLIGDSSGGRAVQRCLEAGGRTSDPLGLAFGTSVEAA